MTELTDRYIEVHSKSKMDVFLLTLFLGPLGLLYASWIGALILGALAILTASTILGPILCWLLSIPVGIEAVNNYNAKVEIDAAMLSGQRLHE